MNETIYYIWLQQVLRYGTNKVRTVRLLYKSISDFYNAGEYQWRLCGCFTNKEIENMMSFSLDDAKLIAEKTYNMGYEVLTLAHEGYPKLLHEIPNPPCALYIKGDSSCLDAELPIAVVGPRNATFADKTQAFKIAQELAASGATVISGGAVGIDCAAHEGALEGGGKTVAVLGCGINHPYLMEKLDLRRKIAQSGAVISEYPPDYPGTRYTFPIRNRIISGLALGTVIVEAGEKSGSLITANLANDQNRDVFVVSVNMDSPNAQGSVALIRDGAREIKGAVDILDEYFKKTDGEIKKEKLKSEILNREILKPKALKKDKPKNIVQEDFPSKDQDKLVRNLSQECKKVYLILKSGKMHIDDIARETGLKAKELLPVITELELLNLIKSYSGRMYKANNQIFDK